LIECAVFFFLYTFTTKPHFTKKKSPSGTSPRSLGALVSVCF
jgi:hypothetical protein